MGEIPFSKENEFLNLSLQQLIDTKVTVASLSEESLEQAPVPVSVISQQMIEQSGALTLKELLITYVPGFTDVEDQNEVNVAARGIFTSSQQKILIMINGHRLNGRSYSMAAPDHSISLNKIAQIEILRGPASSLYGNVSLTATINIILKSAKEIEKTQLSLLIGDFGQKGASLLFGSSNKQFDLMFWANSYQSDGEVKHFAPQDVYSANPVNDNEAIIYGFKDKSPYDIGLTVSSNYGELLLNHRRNHYIEPFSAAGLSGEPYQYNKFEKYNGWGPGIGYTSNHIEYKKSTQIGDWLNETRIYWDDYHTQSELIINPSAPTFGAPEWRDISSGIISTIEAKRWGGELLLGTQIEGYKVFGAKFPLGINSHNFNAENNDMLPSGKEGNISGFGQYKRRINDQWQANLGVRYDYKNRKKTDNVDEISPRLGLVYQQNNINVKFSYSQAFVDATYWNRFSNLPSFKGAGTLKPEKLRSWQISPSITLPDYDMQLVSNIFYDQAIDVIFRDNSAMENNYSNSGKLNTWGIEQEISYLTTAFNLRFNATYRRASSSEKIATHNGYINNVPKLTANLVLDKPITDKLNAHLAIRYVGKQYSPIVIQQDGMKVVDPFPEQGVSFDQPNHYQASSWLLNSNLRYKASDALTLNLRVDNLLDENRYQGGSTLHPYPKRGRWVSLQAQFSF